ncbi:hypothetical protein [Paludisphaera soli]|uniref:hypothetical protein n=1 Tax=Paludisphaera soli TaxID=2712865 RepID=UPI0013EBED93|nr:hypothetical protein [Paludisphaera soli]
MTTLVRDIRGPRRSRILAAAVAALGFLPLGCGLWPWESEPIWGRVVAHGRPVTKGTVILMPVAEDVTTWGVGPIDPTGRFEVSSSRLDVPLQPGRYQLYIRPPHYIDSNTLKPAPPPGYDVPAKYMDPARPIITVHIGGEPTRIDLTLQD